MDEDYEKWEQACREIRQENAKLLDEFSNWLRGKGLSESTVLKHVGNVGFYINEYLLCDSATPAREGAVQIDGFLGDWFIRKALWSSESSMKQTAVGLKKFYGFMFEIGQLDGLDLLFLRDIIKDEMADWLSAVRRYNENCW